MRLRDIAASRGITECSAYGTVTDLAEADRFPPGDSRIRLVFWEVKGR